MSVIGRKKATPEEREHLSTNRVALEAERKKQRRLNRHLGRALDKGDVQCHVQGHRVLVTTVLQPSAPAWPKRSSLQHGTLLQTTTHVKHKQSWVVRQEIRVADLAYADWFWQNNSTWRFDVDLFPNIKEQTESASAYHQLKRHCPAFNVNDDDDSSQAPLCLVVGDGRTPRTGALLARAVGPGQLHQVWSIDPRMVDTNDPALRSCSDLLEQGKLRLATSTAEEFIESHAESTILDAAHAKRPILIVGIHSHAVLSAYIPRIGEICGGACAIWIMAMPCCVEQSLTEAECTALGIKSLRDELDWSVQSPMRRILLWGSDSLVASR